MTAPVKSLEGSSRVRAPQGSGGEAPARISPYFDLKRDPSGREYMEVAVTGIALLRLVLTNKGTAFTHDERVELGLDGLLPPRGREHRRADQPRLPRLSRSAVADREVPVSAPAAGAAGDPVLRAARAAHLGDAADRLHADGRAGGAGVQRALRKPARHLALHGEQLARPARARELPARGRAHDRRHRFVGDPRHRRSGLRRARDSDRQARALHDRRRRQPLPHHAGRARRRHRSHGPDPRSDATSACASGA